MVIFKNLLEDTYIDLNFGIVRKDGTLYCLCGCNGTFEKDDYKIVKEDAQLKRDSIVGIYKHTKEKKVCII